MRARLWERVGGEGVTSNKNRTPPYFSLFAPTKKEKEVFLGYVAKPSPRPSPKGRGS